ncbi:cuticle protein CP14.6 [Manduca sexta]|uniref:Cuticle protein CP14.6 n=2 Tax=Manduca sexta TaxID=7130 RepID=CU15_MANSE|nr:cuticle protein CP14.6 [Manduca sexta]Q94984.1 RecName: Full=Cuticle protein CP14.6; AltName: Full=MSCP14.6; Flags: Precursor [Manduca sexta]AAC47495.1 cuticle protein [Manduca sexta]AAC47496.1 MSCP14.6 cuticle protein [Manduca sexta]KAG6457367.1 hypothetical protein O3G_MSEX010271 [Manduca sexta]KAG6457368.1 hypothetical protein O3G_MSEX010271 [Manduca sexta]
MKSFFVVALLVAAAAAAPANPDADAVIVRYDADQGDPQHYSYSVETSNGIAFSEEGALKNVGSENEANSVRGSYAYVGPDGVTYSVVYIADENGFQPQGAHLPVAA